MWALLLSCALAEPRAEFDAANAALAAGDLAGAAAGYEKVVAAGGTGGDVWFNLGNVYYRQGELPRAVLAWRRAELRDPRDPDVAANLEFARRKLPDRLDVARRHPSFAPWQVALTVDEARWLGWAAVGLGLLAAAGRGLTSRFPLAGVGGAAAAGGLTLLAGAWAQERLPPGGVVLAEEVSAQSDLGGGVTLFTLHGGAEVEVTEQAAGKVQIRLPDGRRGWVAAEAVGVVDPEAPAPGPPSHL